MENLPVDNALIKFVLTLFGFHTMFSTRRHKPLVRVPEYHPILRGNTPNIRVIIAQWRCYLHLIDAIATLARFLLEMLPDAREI